MKKVLTIAIMLLWDYIIATTALEMGYTTIYSGLNSVTDNNISLTFGASIRMFYNMLLFNVDGIPNVMILLFIYLPNIVLFIVFLMLVFDRGD